jgi:hypothetical protein
MMTEGRGIVAALAMVRKGMKEVKILTFEAYGNKSLKKTQVCQIIKDVKEEKHSQ